MTIFKKKNNSKEHQVPEASSRHLQSPCADPCWIYVGIAVVTTYIVMVCIVTAYINMAYIVMAYIVLAYIVMADIVMADVLMAYTVMGN